MKNILVVDDEFEVRELLSDYLSAQGYNVLLAGDGRAGLDSFRTNEIDIIILDLAMPVMNGVECLREIRKTHSDIPVVIISGNLNDEFLEGLSTLSVQHILEKPLDIHRLGFILQKF